MKRRILHLLMLRYPKDLLLLFAFLYLIEALFSLISIGTAWRWLDSVHERYALYRHHVWFIFSPSMPAEPSSHSEKLAVHHSLRSVLA